MSRSISISSRSRSAEQRNPAAGRAILDIAGEIVRWSEREPDLNAPPFLLARDTYTAIGQLQDAEDSRFEMVSVRHRLAVRRHLAPILQEVAQGRSATGPELRMLQVATGDDPIQSAFSPATGADAIEDLVQQRIQVMRRVWAPLSQWWQGYFAGTDDSGCPAVDVWQLYIPFAQWIVREKRRRRPHELFMVGFNGSPGAGKTLLTNALTVVLNELLDAEVEGQAIARSGDDWYLSRSDRERLKAQGYDPGVPGLTNRALPGTHDLEWLQRNVSELERSTHDSVIRMGNFDKRIDDQPTEGDRYFDVRGKVAVFLFDLWFAGANTDVDPAAVPDGLRRRVAENLRTWRPIFDRMDALWVCDWPSYERMLEEREAQERLVERRRGERGMSPDGVRAFMAYMLDQAWDWCTTSPIPPNEAITFRARRDFSHRVIGVETGGYAS